MNELAKDLKALGSGSTKYAYDKPAPELLESFPNPAMLDLGYSVAGDITLNIRCPEFTSLCPLTGQPDFACIVIDYKPDMKCVESKALKLYLGSFRNHGEFHEACVYRIGCDLVKLLDPLWLTVKGEFTPRGGIPFWPTFTYQRPHDLASARDTSSLHDSDTRLLQYANNAVEVFFAADGEIVQIRSNGFVLPLEHPLCGVLLINAQALRARTLPDSMRVRGWKWR